MEDGVGHQRWTPEAVHLLCIFYLMRSQWVIRGIFGFADFLISSSFFVGSTFPAAQAAVYPLVFNTEEPSTVIHGHPRCIPGLDSDLSTGHLGLYTT